MAFLKSQAKYKAFIGGIGSGKTFAGAANALLQAQAGTLGMILAPTFPMLRDASLRTFRELAGDLIAEFNKSEMIITLTNGAEILCRSADAPDRLRGPNLDWLWLDEAGYMDALIWKIGIGRLRRGGKAGPAWVTTTPKGFNWVYETFGPLAVDKAAGEVALFTVATKDNPYLPPEYLRSLERDYTGAFARQELEGAFVQADGSVFRRVRDCVPEGAEWPIEPFKGTFIGGLDFGQKHDYTVLVVMDAATRRVVAMDRFNKVDWAYQRERIKQVARAWSIDVIIAESNSIGQPNIEALVEDNIAIQPFVTTNATKSRLIQKLVLDIENRNIVLPEDHNLLSELEAFEQEQTPTGLMKYSAPDGGYDDCVMALALANWGAQSGGFIS